MLEASWLEYIQRKSAELKRAPDPIKGHKPRVTRHQSPRMRRIQGQTPNPVRAAYVPESDSSRTPTKPNGWKGTKAVGGNCENPNAGHGKETASRNPGNSQK